MVGFFKSCSCLHQLFSAGRTADEASSKHQPCRPTGAAVGLFSGIRQGTHHQLCNSRFDRCSALPLWLCVVYLVHTVGLFFRGNVTDPTYTEHKHILPQEWSSSVCMLRQARVQNRLPFGQRPLMVLGHSNISIVFKTVMHHCSCWLHVQGSFLKVWNSVFCVCHMKVGRLYQHVISCA